MANRVTHAVLVAAPALLIIGIWLNSSLPSVDDTPSVVSQHEEPLTLPIHSSNRSPAANAPLALSQLERWIFQANGTTPSQILAFISQQISHLPAEQQQQILDLATRFIAYKEALVELADGKYEAQFNAEALGKQLEQKRQLQYQFFTEDQVEQLFSKQHQQDAASLERLQIRQDTPESSNERWQLIEQQISQQSPLEQRAFAPSVQMRHLERMMQEEPGTISREALVSEFGEAAGERLHQTVTQQERWQQQLSQAQAELDVVMQNHTGKPRQQAIDEIINRFAPHQRRRAQALLGLLDTK